MRAAALRKEFRVHRVWYSHWTAPSGDSPVFSQPSLRRFLTHLANPDSP